MIRVLLVDDHTVVRFGFRLLLESVADVKVVAEADSGETACASYSECKPDVVIMDLSMPGMGGIEALKRIRTHHPDARLLALSAHDDVMHARRALNQGALGFLSKRSAPETLLDAVRAVASGKRYIDASPRTGAGSRGNRRWRGSADKTLVGARIRDLPSSRQGRSRPEHRQRSQLVSVNRGHAPVQHQTETRRQQPGRTHAHSIASGID